jgi:glycosyltransferase involved in cell wall biosynthesis
MTKKIRLFVDAHVFDGLPQGTVSYIAGLYSELLKMPEFEIFVGSEDEKRAQVLLESKNFTHIKYKCSSKIKRLLFVIPSAIKKYDIEYAHFQYISPLFLKCKSIVTIHDLLFLEFPQNFPLLYRIKNRVLFYISAKRADLLFTVSNYSKASIEKFFHISGDNIFITPNAVKINKDVVIPVEELVNKSFILYVSRIEPRKNQSLLLDIWIELKLYLKETELVIVGGIGIEDKRYMNQVLTMPEEIRPHFYWFKDVVPEKLTWLYKNCKLFIYPSIAEGFGIPPLEAVYCGASVLCSNKTAMRDFSFLGEYLFSPDNTAEFKDKLTWALSSSFPHEPAQKVVLEKYSWDKISRGFSSEIFKIGNDEK